ncbi:MAG: hypothetical protein LQ345_002005 [Seirophora villosa]|nr:MAG: hypothetical protein LQ345_002005 [Seirophora villosa]
MGQNTLRDLDSHDLNDPDTINTSIMVQHESSEIRMMIYKAYFSAANQRPQGDLQPCDVPVAILRVSKTVYAEASPIHYQEYYFVAPSSAGPFHYQYHGPPLGQLISHRELPPGSEALDFSSATEAKLVEDVSKIFTKYRKDLPKWLFGAAYVRNPLSFRSVAKPRMPGYDIARYLRQIGSQNAAEIRSLRIKMSAYRTAHSRQRCYELSLYSTIIRQHIYNVRDIVLEEFLESCKADIRRAFEEKSAAAAAQERRALRNAVKGLTKPGHGG